MQNSKFKITRDKPSFSPSLLGKEEDFRRNSEQLFFFRLSRSLKLPQSDEKTNCVRISEILRSALTLLVVTSFLMSLG